VGTLQRSRRLVLGDRALVVFGDCADIGHHRAPEADLPLNGWVEPRHAQLARRGSRFRLTPYPGAWVTVKGIGEVGGEGHTLSDGEELRFDNYNCRWVFRQPTSAHSTAVLETADSTCPPASTVDGVEFRSLVLAADDLVIGRSEPVHLVWPDLPCSELRLGVQLGGTVIHVVGGRARIGHLEAPDVDMADPVAWAADGATVPLVIPGAVDIEPELDATEWLSLAMLTRSCPFALTLRVTEPGRPEQKSTGPATKTREEPDDPAAVARTTTPQASFRRARY
jgi:hypothetical protein